jgi:hypothetical protein
MIQGEWTKESCGGTVMNHPTWMNNPQYLLSLKQTTEVHIRVYQPDTADEKISFYVIKYDSSHSFLF